MPCETSTLQRSLQMTLLSSWDSLVTSSLPWTCLARETWTLRPWSRNQSLYVGAWTTTLCNTNMYIWCMYIHVCMPINVVSWCIKLFASTLRLLLMEGGISTEKLYPFLKTIHIYVRTCIHVHVNYIIMHNTFSLSHLPFAFFSRNLGFSQKTTLSWKWSNLRNSFMCGTPSLSLEMLALASQRSSAH